MKNNGLSKVAKYLTYKADIYHPTLGRIYSFESKWKADGENLTHGNRIINPVELYNGYGRQIIARSNAGTFEVLY